MCSFICGIDSKVYFPYSFWFFLSFLLPSLSSSSSSSSPNHWNTIILTLIWDLICQKRKKEQKFFLRILLDRKRIFGITRNEKSLCFSVLEFLHRHDLIFRLSLLFSLSTLNIPIFLLFSFILEQFVKVFTTKHQQTNRRTKAWNSFK